MSLFRAEWQKVIRNRWLTGCTVGVFPILAAGISLVVLFAAILSSDIREQVSDNPTPWTETSLYFWAIPNSIIGRLIIVGFAAALFGGEYQWGTWKNLITRRGRVSLILTKFLTLGIFMVAAFLLTSVIWVAGRGLVQWVVGGAYPPALNDIPVRYWNQLFLNVLVAFMSTLILAAAAALVALLTRSIFASVLLGLASAILDGLIGLVLLTLYALTDIRLLPSLYRFSISYNVENLLNFANGGDGIPVLSNVDSGSNQIVRALAVDPPITGNSLAISLAILLTWMLVLVSLSVYSFYRQDIVS